MFRLVLAAIALALCPPVAHAQQKLHFTYLWHLEQPIYWPDRQVSGADRYERASESLLRAGVHPTNNLNDIFGVADRVAVYQDRVRDSVRSFAFPSSGTRPEAGAQVTYSGGLVENIQSLAGTSLIGGQYRTNWFSSIREGRAWTTTSPIQVPRVDVVVFPFHHALMPLCDESAMRKEIQIYKAIYADAWGTSPSVSKGFFPSEMAFSTRMIGVLADEGIEWSVVSGEKLSRACANFPTIFGSGGVNCDPPNKADQLNPAQADYFRMTISRGCGPAEAYPFAFTPHRARYVDPETGVAKGIIVVPASQSLGWTDGYSAQGISEFDTLNAKNDPARPMLVLLAHDGDNAWGGGYTYYLEATPNRVAQASAAGYTPTVVQRYLADHPVPANDFIHVEDGAWVNADSDFGSPSFINWNYPLLNAAGQIDPANGWHVDERNWAVITAAQNRMDTAEAIYRAAGGNVDPRKIVYPQNGANAVENAWHYFLASLNSGYMYYGNAEDFEVKPTLGCNNAVRLADPVISAAGASADNTPPTIWIPQRHPWNPGSTNFGVQYGYTQNTNNGDFWVWTFAYDVSGLTNVTLRYRLDNDGARSLSNTENETYAGGAGVGAWQSLPMTRRVFPAGNVYNDPSINFFVAPTYIADHFAVQVTGIRSKLVDYYVEATDTRGNVKRSPIQHVYVGDGSGASGGTNTVVTTQPAPPIAGQQVTISYDPAGRNLATAAQVLIHTGINGWTNVIAPDPAMSRVNAASPWTYTFTVPASATQIDCVFNNGAGTWDNNSGADWHISVQPAPPVNGSCCVLGVCSLQTQSACAGLAGVFTIGGDCGIACPPPPTGACCAGAGAGAGGCTLTLQSLCSGAGQTWISAGLCSPSPCPFVMDGVVDSDTTQVASSGALYLRAALRGDVLYLAAPNAPDGRDRFIYLTGATGPGTPQAANWSKGGTIAAFSCFLASENDNAYVGWQNTLAGVGVASFKTTTGAPGGGGVIEGTVNLRQQLGLSASAPLPESVYLSYAQYATANGGALVAANQLPPSVNSDANIDAGEFVRVRLCALNLSLPGCCLADFNRDGARNVNDIFVFLAAWFAKDLSTDINASGASEVTDIFAFLSLWFAGC